VSFYNEEAEMAVLGAVMLSDKAAQRLAPTLKPEHFFFEGHQVIWKSIQVLSAKGSTVDLVTMRDTMLQHGTLERAGGVGYLVRLVDDVPSAASAGDYAQIILEKYARRTLKDRAEAFVKCCEKSPDLEHVLATAETLTDGLRVGIRPVVDASDVLSTLGKSTGVTGLSTGIQFIDQLSHHGGMPCAEVSILGGQTGAGKTLMATQITAHDLRQGRAVLFVSLEMTASQLLSRLMQQLSGYRSEYDAKQAGDLASWKEAAEIIHTTRLLIYDSVLASDPTANDILAWLEDEHQRDPVHRVFVDYAQKLTLAGARGAENWDVQRQISEMFRRFAKASGVSLGMLSQVNPTEHGWSLRGSKEWENDSALTILNTLVKSNRDFREITAVKNRHGACRKWDAAIDQRYLTLVDRGGFL